MAEKTVYEKSLELHEEKHGKVEVISKVVVENKEQLAQAYSPGVAEPCRRIAADANDVYKYTAKGNLVAVVSDGTAVLGLGDIGPLAAMPVMEGKAILFKEFADVDAFPICLDTKDTEEIIETVKRIAPTFGGINLEDISAPRCFEIERRLKEELDIPVFHDDQHGTAIVVCAGLINALKVVGKKWEDVNIVINGAGSAGISICKLILQFGAGNVVLVDRQGALCPGEEWMNPAQKEMAEITNKGKQRGPLAEIIKGQNVVKLNDFRILNEINYVGDVEGISIYKVTYSYWKGNEIEAFLELETTNEVPMLSQYFYYDEKMNKLFLTYPTDKNIQIYQYNNQSMEMIDTIEYQKDNMNYTYSVFTGGKVMHVYEDDNQRCFIVDDTSIILGKDYDVQLCKDYIFAFSKYETDKIIDHTKSKEYLFDSEFSLNYASYWNEDNNVSFMIYDTDKKAYVYTVFDQGKLITYELPFKNDAVVFRVDERSYGFIVEQNQTKTIYLFEVND